MIKRYFFFFFLALISVGCGKGFQTIQTPVGDLSSQLGGGNSNPPSEVPEQPGPVVPAPTPTPTPGPSPSPTDPLGGICNDLSFTGVTWPQSLTSPYRKAFALGLDITGSFEGHSGWGNITNNFDGQGISLGLLQQNLGQGSLQPLLIKMNSQHQTSMKFFFSAADLESMQGMLAQWQAARDIELAGFDEGDELFPDRMVLSPLDQGPLFHVKLTTQNAQSVAWAVENLYTDGGTTFKSRWKNSFSSMAVSPEYRTIQLEAALPIFTRAESYFRSFGFTEMRMLLLMFDFVTQNGGFNSTHKAQFDAYKSANPLASETTLAMKLLEIRLVSVIDEYKEDVRSRKSTIINGTGYVHGANRNLPVEYCYQPREKI